MKIIILKYRLMLIKNNVYALLIYHIVQANIVFLATYHAIGILLQKNVKAVNKMHILILVWNLVLIVLLIALYGTEINVYLARLDQILMQSLVSVNFVHLDLHTMIFLDNVYVLRRHPTYTKTMPVSIVSRHIFGINKRNHVKHARWHIFMMYHWENVPARLALLMREIQSACHVVSLFIGII